MRARTWWMRVRLSVPAVCMCLLHGAAALPEPAPAQASAATTQATTADSGAAAALAGIDPATRALFTSPPAPVETAVPAAAAQRRDGDLALPFETGYTGEQRFNTHGIENLLDADDFPQRIGQLRQETAIDADAQAFTEAYRAVAERAAVAEGSALRLEALACGLQVCIASLSGGDPIGHAEWAARFHGEAGLGVGFRYRSLMLPGGASVLRLFFYADPALPVAGVAAGA